MSMVIGVASDMENSFDGMMAQFSPMPGARQGGLLPAGGQKKAPCGQGARDPAVRGAYLLPLAFSSLCILLTSASTSWVRSMVWSA